MTCITGSLRENLYTYMIISHWIFLKMWNVLGKIGRENFNTLLVLNNVFPKILPLLDNVEKYSTAI
jgi:hypothetical protein